MEFRPAAPSPTCRSSKMEECPNPDTVDRSARVSALELFFDLVFVFTITQLTGVLVAGGDATSALQVVVMLAVIWWMYDGYAWLTNAIATDLLRFRLLLLGGMGAFLVIALAIPSAYEATGLAFGVGYTVVVLLHAGMYAKGTSVSEVAAILGSFPSTSRPQRWCCWEARREGDRRTLCGRAPRCSSGSRPGSRAPRAS